MPLGKSGKFHMNPHHMRAVGDAPDEHDDKSAAAEHAKDGKHRHELTQHEDGSYSSKHTHPDGKVEHEDHPDFHHAVSHMADKMGEEGMDHDEPDGDEDMGGGSDSGPLESMYE